MRNNKEYDFSEALEEIACELEEIFVGEKHLRGKYILLRLLKYVLDHLL